MLELAQGDRASGTVSWSSGSAGLPAPPTPSPGTLCKVTLAGLAHCLFTSGTGKGTDMCARQLTLWGIPGARQSELQGINLHPSMLLSVLLSISVLLRIEVGFELRPVESIFTTIAPGSPCILL